MHTSGNTPPRREGEEALRAIVASLDDIVLIFDAGYHFRNFWANHPSFLFLPPDQFLGRTFRDVFGEAFARPFEALADQAMAGPDPAPFDYPSPDGKSWYAAEVRRVRDEGTVPLLSMLVRNITARKQAELALEETARLLRVAQETARIGSWTYYARDHITWSDELYRLFGMPRDFVPDAASFLNLVHPEDRSDMEQWVEKCYCGEEPGEFEFRAIRPDGSTWSVSARGALIPEASGRGSYVSGTAQDITERKQTEEALRRSQKMEAIGQLTGGIAHDFNNILGIILGNVELLEVRGGIDATARKRVESIRKAADRAANLTRQLLGFARTRSSVSASVDVRARIREMESLVARALTPEITVAYRFAENLWLTQIDPGEFDDAILNLILNARDVMSGGGVITIDVSNCTIDQTYCSRNAGATPGEFVRVSVIDSGPGIAPENLLRVFEPFFTTKAPGAGTGLGLSLVFGFARRSAGFVDVQSELGFGSVFRVYLPRAEHAAESTPLDSASVSLPRGRETILVVDDEEGLLDIARISLEELGYRVLTAVDGRKALEKLSEEPSIELLFTDVVMPGGLGGYELAQQALASNPQLKVLFTSGYSGQGPIGTRLPEHADLLIKPYVKADLAQRLRSILDNP